MATKERLSLCVPKSDCTLDESELRGDTLFSGDFVSRTSGDERVELEWRDHNDLTMSQEPLQRLDGTVRFICLATLLLRPPKLQPDPIRRGSSGWNRFGFWGSQCRS